MRGVWISLAVAGLAASIACGGGGGGGGGAVFDNTAASQGAITRVGSAEVAGTLWNTTAVPAQVVFDETGVGAPADLAPGMLVRIQGQRGQDPTTATANLVFAYDAVQGPVESVTDIDADRAELVVVGRTVVALRDVTAFGGSAGFGFDTLAPDDLVEVWGHLDDVGVVQATRIEKYGDYAGGNPAVEITGPITNIQTSDPAGGTFDLNGLSVVYLDEDLIGVPGGEAGLDTTKWVGVKGTLIVLNDEIATGEVHIRGPLTSDIIDFELEGIVSEFTDLASPFRVAGQPVQVALLSTFEPASLGDAMDDRFLANGMKVEVGGALSGGTLTADRLRFRDEEVFVAAQIAMGTDIDEDAGTVTLLRGITVVVDGNTRLEDQQGANPFSLANLMSGDYLEVRGIDLDGQVLATSLVRKLAPGNIVVRGRVEGFEFIGPPEGQFTMLGLDLFVVPKESITTDAGTTFSEFPGGVATETAFYNFLIANPGALIQVTDSTGSAAEIDVANQIEYEDE